VTQVRFAEHFLSLRELLAAPQTVDPSLLNPSPARAIGLLPALLAGLGALRIPRLPARARPLALFFLGGLLLYGALTLPLSAPLWSALPPLQLVQFPWRLLAPAALCAAFLLALLAVRWQWVAVFGSLLLLADLFWLAPTSCLPPEQANSSAFRRYGTTIGVDGAREHLPATVTELAAAPDWLPALAAGETPNRLPGATMLEADPLAARYQLALAEERNFRFEAAKQAYRKVLQLEPNNHAMQKRHVAFQRRVAENRPDAR